MTLQTIIFLKDYKEQKGRFSTEYKKDEIVHVLSKKAAYLVNSNVAAWA